MLKTNLSTRPFYNERAIHWALALAFVAIVALTVFNVTHVLALSAKQGTLAADVQRQDARIQELTAQATRARGSIDQKALARVLAAAKEANAIIDERTFSWTELFNHLESTLPNGVMLTSVRPAISKTDLRVQIVVLGREVEQIDEFIEKLEATGVFSQVMADEESVTKENDIEVRLEAHYKPASRAAAAPASAPDQADPKAEPKDPKADPKANPKAASSAPASSPRGES